MKKILFGGLLAAFLFSGLAQAADCARAAAAPADGDILYVSNYNAEWNNIISCTNARIQDTGDTITGDLTNNGGSYKVWGGNNTLLYSDSGTNLTIGLYGTTGKIVGAPAKAGAYNIDLARATTSVTGDSIKIQCGGAACSATNPGYVVMNGTTAGALTLFRITADVTINLTGATWGADTTGDLTGRILRVLADDDNGTLRWCTALLGGRQTLLTTDTNATASNIDLPEEVLCNAAVASATNTVLEVGYFRSDFDDTGGSSENLNTVQSGVNDIVTGQTADGLWQPWNAVFAGFSSDPSGGFKRWSQSGRDITAEFEPNSGTSNATSLGITLPTKSAFAWFSQPVGVIDNGTQQVSPGMLQGAAGSTTMTVSKDFSGAVFTGSGSKNAFGSCQYEVGPAASFIE